MRRVLIVAVPALLAAACATTPRGEAADLLATRSVRVVNRASAPLVEGARRGLRLDERPGDGIAWVEGAEMGDGEIEVEIRGKDVLQRSFVGVAFHAADDSTYDAVYLRPFNFRAADPVRRDHAVQYVSHPAHPWPRLRQEHPEVYENPVVPAPDPNEWVRLRVVVRGPRVSVYVGEGAEPDLEVQKLNGRARGRVGLWVGHQSGGDFAGLRVTPG